MVENKNTWMQRFQGKSSEMFQKLDLSRESVLGKNVKCYVL